MTLEELRILRIIQGILVRNYINTQKLDVQVIGSSVYLEGEWEVFDYHPGQKRPDPAERDLETARTLLHAEKEIRSMGEIAHIEFKLRNWQRVASRWTRTHVY
jgi:hypothetical protein